MGIVTLVIIGGRGFAGEETMADDCYERLLQIAPDSTWVRLSFSKKPVVRMYAFDALFYRNSPDLKGVKDRLRNDKAAVLSVSGCTEITASICFFVSIERNKVDSSTHARPSLGK